MTTKLQHALNLAEMGFYVFPLKENSKLPAIKKFPVRATRNKNKIIDFWTCNITGDELNYNIGISTSDFGDGKALLVIDIDNKNGKNGSASLTKFEKENGELDTTLASMTPTGGFHLMYVVDEAITQGVNILGDGVDTRSKGGYIVAPGSELDIGKYEWLNGQENL